MAALDSRDFEAVRRRLTGVVAVDASGIWGDPPVTVEAEALIQGWRAVIVGLDAIRHDLGPCRVAVGGDRAEIACPVEVRHYLDGECWRVAGEYRIGLTRVADWRVSALTYLPAEETGERRLVEDARRRAMRRAG